MVITSEDIRKKFLELLQEIVSREEAAKWSTDYQKALDLGILEFYPLNEEDKIWDALEFIELYYEKLDPLNYLYSRQDLLEYMSNKNWNK